MSNTNVAAKSRSVQNTAKNAQSARARLPPPARVGANTIVKGLRAYSDFDAELQQALMNRKLAPDIHTVFLMSSFTHIFVSSSILKDIASYGGKVSDLVPPPIARALKEKYR